MGPLTIRDHHRKGNHMTDEQKQPGLARDGALEGDEIVGDYVHSPDPVAEPFSYAEATGTRIDTSFYLFLIKAPVVSLLRGSRRCRYRNVLTGMTLSGSSMSRGTASSAGPKHLRYLVDNGLTAPRVFKRLRLVVSAHLGGCGTRTQIRPGGLAMRRLGVGVLSPLAVLALAASAGASPVVGRSLMGVSCSWRTACTAVGGQSGTSSPLIERLDWWGWKVQPTPGAGSLNGVSCRSRRECVAVGSDDASGTGQPGAERWDGTRWSVMNVAGPSGWKTSGLSSVSCPSARVCYAVGAGSTTGFDFGVGQEVFAERWDGTSWQVQNVPNPPGETGATLTGVSCTSRTACTAVGEYQPSGNYYVPLVERWNGVAWQAQDPAIPPGVIGFQLNAVSCVTASACTAVGGLFDSTSAGVQQLIESWDGTSWSVSTAPAPPTGASFLSMNGISCGRRDRCAAVGNYTDSSGLEQPTAEISGSGGWRLVSAAAPPAGTQAGLEDVSCEAAWNCIAVGTQYTSSGSQTLAEHWDGTSWKAQATP